MTATTKTRVNNIDTTLSRKVFIGDAQMSAKYDRFVECWCGESTSMEFVLEKKRTVFDLWQQKEKKMSSFEGHANAYSYDLDNLDQSLWTEKDEVGESDHSF